MAEQSSPTVEDLTALATLAANAGKVGACWSLVSGDLNLNFVRLGAGEAVAPHINAEVDVVGVVITGAGTLDLEERAEPLRAGQLFFIPKGARRGIQAATDDELVYLTCHRRRGALTIGRGGRTP